MFDEAFFTAELPERALEFVRERGGLGMRVDVVTRGGERIDVLAIRPETVGARLVTRDDRLVFVPYEHIAHVDVSLLLDHRIESFELPPAG